MAALRLVLIALVLAAHLIVGLPLQSVVVRFAPRFSSRLPTLFCRSLLWLIRCDLVVHGNIATGRPVLLASNHVSWIDILALGAMTPFCFLAKREVATWPILSFFAEIQGTVFVDRRRKRSIPKANRRMAARMMEGRSVLLFPEGTTVGAFAPGRFLSSHFAAPRELLRMDGSVAAVAVQPVAVAYSAADAAWVGDDDLISHLWRTLRNPPLRCVLSFGAPMSVTLEADRKQIARMARESVVALLRATPVTCLGPLETAGDDAGLSATKPCWTKPC